VVDRAIDLLKVDAATDTVIDIGAGDGRFMLRCCERTGSQLIGVEIDEERGAEAQAKIDGAGDEIRNKCRLIIGNALEQDYSMGTAFFLYLIPRGLRIVLPILQAIPRKIRVVTYISPFPDSVKPVEIVRVNIEKHADAGVEWPLFVYELNGEREIGGEGGERAEGGGAATAAEGKEALSVLNLPAA